MEKSIYIGRTKEGDFPITVMAELKEAEVEGLTITLNPIQKGSMVLSLHGSIGRRESGPIDESLKRLLAEGGINYAAGWDGHRLALLLQMWDRWHLNDLKPGCIHQIEKDWGKKELTLIHVKLNSWRIKDQTRAKRVERVFEKFGTFMIKNEFYSEEFLAYDILKDAKKGIKYTPKSPAEQSWFDHGVIEFKEEKRLSGWVKPEDHPEGVLMRMCPDCGYRYGEKWLYLPLPEEVIDWWNRLDWISGDTQEEIERGTLAGFIRAHGISADIKRIKERPKGCTPWEGDDESKHFHVELSIPRGDGIRTMTVIYSQGGGIEEEPGAADVLRCVGDDARDVDGGAGFAEWVRNFGYDEDSRKARAIYRACQSEARRLKAFLGPDFYREFMESLER